MQRYVCYASSSASLADICVILQINHKGFREPGTSTFGCWASKPLVAITGITT